MERIMDAPYNLTTGLPEQVSFRGLNAGAGFIRAVARAVAPIRAWIEKQHRIDQIERTLNRRSDRQLADMGLTREDIPAVARGLPLATPRREFDNSTRSAAKPVSLMPLAMMR